MSPYDGWRRDGWQYGGGPGREMGPAGWGYRDGPYEAGGDWTRDPRNPDDEARLIDEQIRLLVRQRLFEDNWLDSRGIDIKVDDRVVTLTGSVRSHLESRYAWDDAWETQLVRGVISSLEVEAPSEQDDQTESG